LWSAVSTREAPVRGVVHLWGLDRIGTEGDAPGTCVPEEVGRTVVGGALHLLKTVIGRADEATPALWFVTSNAVAVRADAGALSLAQSPLWGLCAVMALEHPSGWGGLIDLPSEIDDKVIPSLLSELLSSDSEDRIAYRDGGRYVQRLSRSCPPLSPPVTCGEDETWLVTGGTGALGLLVARWLVGQGVRHLVLAGRRGLSSPSVAEAVETLERKGATVRVVSADVSRRTEVESLLADIGGNMPPLRGLVHAAGVHEDGALFKHDDSRLASVMAPKVSGAWTLHTLTSGLPLRHFVMFSSAASVVGSAGMGSEAAACAFMDALAHYRRANGLPALSVNWGSWADGGMDAGVTARQSRFGVNAMSSGKALQSLELLLSSEAPQVLVADIQWPVFRGVYEAHRRRPLLAEMGGAPAPDDRRRPERRVANPPQTPVEEQLAPLWSAVLKIEDVDRTESFFEAGGNSLLATRLAARIRDVFGVDLQLGSILETPTLSQLASEIESHQAAGSKSTAAALVPLDRAAHRRVRPANPTAKENRHD
jgi:NAD(P)-dependent dehydrogenase (short-subunit alcohol dehydrogenase family)/acyl carrier protein